MTEEQLKILKETLDEANFTKLMALKNDKLHQFVADSVRLCEPDDVFVCTDSADDIAAIRRRAIDAGEESPLAIEGHTVHFDGPQDQARAKEVTRYLLRPGVELGKNLNAMNRDEGLREVRGFLKGAMTGRTMLVRFFCLGPTDSRFSISGVQLTDSYYVAHSEDLLYRSGYEQFKRLKNEFDFFRVLHSAGRLEGTVSAEVDKKRVYIDLDDEEVYSVNTQYAGNTVGFKKLSHRLAIAKADREDWLSEHMLLMGVHGPAGRVTYFTGAFPSACGKTSTAMLQGETIIGDDLAYLRKVEGEVRAVNAEAGIFGIIRDVNPDDDPIIWEVLNKPGEVIFSNVLIADGVPYWLGGGREIPDSGANYAGEWHKGKTDAQGNVIDPSHKNARYTIRLDGLTNLDERAHDAEGVSLGGIIYGGRDSDTCVPVTQSFDWTHGVITMGASLESETTAATLGKTGVRAFQPMSNLDFISIPLGQYVENHLGFVAGLKNSPKIFGVNYFLKSAEGKYLTGMDAKRVWVKWMELRVHGDVRARRTPTGFIPLHEDLRQLFSDVLGQDYPEVDYVEQFSLRVPEMLAKLDRIEKIWRDVADAPPTLFETLQAQRSRIEAARAESGDRISPLDFPAE
jgi:phosphoenolpyruvate carboxykinase (GTP)